MAGFLKLTGFAPREAISAAALIDAVGDADLAARIAVKVSPRARRVSLRIDPAAGQVILVQPARASARSVLAFTASRREWIAAHLASLPARVDFTDGVVIPLRGESHVVRFLPESRGGVWRDAGQIFVTGRNEHGPRRLRDWLKAEAKALIAPTARIMAGFLKRTVTHVGVRDTTSRWGSCSHTGRLSFSWRLILAPAHVLTYVIAHEVAHLKHMNHGPGFWRTVDEVLTQYALETGAASINAASARHWLRRNGGALHAYG